MKTHHTGERISAPSAQRQRSKRQTDGLGTIARQWRVSDGRSKPHHRRQMQITQGNVLQSLRGVQAFLDTNADQLPGLKESGARVRLDALVEELGSHAAAQTGTVLAAKGATQK